MITADQTSVNCLEAVHALTYVTFRQGSPASGFSVMRGLDKYYDYNVVFDEYVD